MALESTPITSDPAADPRRWKALGVLAAGLAMIVLDGTIVGVALPTIIKDLHLDLTDAQWVNAIYNVIFAALLLTMGRLADRWGRRKFFLAGVSLFLIGSILAAVSGGASSLIWSRVVQGLGGAMILPTTLSTVNATFRGKDRAQAFGIWGAVMSGSAALGPLLGGVFTQYATWRWIFWVNVPIGLLIMVGALLTVPETRGLRGAKGLDVDGLLASGVGFGGLVFALIEGASLGWWRPRSDFAIGSFVWPVTAPISPVPVIGAIGVLSILLFLRWERHRARVGRDALLDLSLFQIGTFSWGNLTAMMVAVGEFGLMLVLPLYLVNAVGVSTLTAGLCLAAMALGAFFAGASARHLAARLGAPGVVLLGLSLEVVGVLALAAVVLAHAGVGPLSGCLIVYGIGLGLASAQLTGTVLADIPPEQSGQGSATQSTVRQLGSALGSALTGTALAIGLSITLPPRLTGLPAGQVAALTQGVIDSAGGSLPALQAQHSPLFQPLLDGFAQAAAGAVLVAAFFLLLGLLGAVQVRRAHRES